MTILWCGGEYTDVLSMGGNSFTTTSTYFRSGYARCAVQISSSHAVFLPFTGGAVTSFWLSVRLYLTGLGTTSVGFGLCKSGTFKGIYVGTAAASNSRFAICKYDGTTRTELIAEEGNSLAGGLKKIDFQVTNYGANAVVNLWVDGTQIITDQTVDASLAGVSDLDSFICAKSGNYTYNLCEIIVSTTDTRNMSLVTLIPAAGDTLDWTGSYADIDEATIDDSDVLYDNTDGHQAIFALSNLPAGSFSVLAVRESVRACRSSDSTPTSLDLGIKSGGSVDVASNHSLTTAWAHYQRLMVVNPVGGSPFTPAELDALQMVLESEA